MAWNHEIESESTFWICMNQMRRIRSVNLEIQVILTILGLTVRINASYDLTLKSTTRLMQRDCQSVEHKHEKD